MEKENYQLHFEKGISYQNYFLNMESELNSGVETKYTKYIHLNIQRSKRLDKTFHLDRLPIVLKSEIKWLVITEHWCGDSSQILPVINKIVLASAGKIDLRIVYRDENIDLMSAHLTDGSKSIPKLIQLNKDFKLINDWGPRPEEAQKLVKELKSNVETAKTYSDLVQKWYNDDKQKAIVNELLRLLVEIPI
ncbi:MAG: thioredoxin family protein [Bacteroidetes bacterium]|nr:thioredoxin family protein [Bacteroidota bacterium]